MIKFMLFLAVVCCLASIALSALALPTHIEINRVDHSIFLDTNFEYHTDKITITNVGNTPLNSFVHTIHSSSAEHVSYVRAGPVETSGIYHAIRFTPNPKEYPQLPQQYKYYHIHFKKDIAPGDQFTFQLTAGFHNTYIPFPATITQAETQRMIYYGYTHFFSMYKITTCSTLVVMFSTSIDSFSPRRGVEKLDGGRKLKYPAITEPHPKPFELGEELIVHAQNHSPFYHFKTAQRYFDVSTSGKINVVENYDIQHVGAKLVGPFHRYIHERNQMRGQSPGPEISSLVIALPHTAENIDFRDFNGNISTSRVYKGDEATHMTFQLRYPLYGGWKSDFEVGYDYFESDVTAVMANEKNQVTLSIPFGYPFKDGNGDNIELRVLLPEGAGDISWTTPFDIDSVKISTIVSYKDATGRTAVTFKSQNITPNMWDDVRITYTLPAPGAFAIPRVAYLIAVTLFIFVFFSVVDVSLGQYQTSPTLQTTKVEKVAEQTSTEQSQPLSAEKITEDVSNPTKKVTISTAQAETEFEAASTVTKRGKKSTTKK